MYRSDLSGSQERLLDGSTEKSGITQLRAGGKGAAFVKLVDGKSSDTKLAYMDSDGKVEQFHDQASSQFHPLPAGDALYYAHVSCRLICNPIIQDVWRRNVKTGQAEQLTMLNATTYLHSVTQDGRLGAISSNARGYYHIAVVDLYSGDLVWLTNGQVTDSNPTIAGDDRVYFIRRLKEGSFLYSAPLVRDEASKENVMEPIRHQLPKGITKVRYMEFTY